MANYKKNRGYAADYRKEVLDYLNTGLNTYRGTAKKYDISTSTIHKWIKLLEETGSLEDPAVNYVSKLDAEKLSAFISKNPTATQAEIVEYFNCTQQAISRAIKSFKIDYQQKPTRTKEKSSPKP